VSTQEQGGLPDDIEIHPQTEKALKAYEEEVGPVNYEELAKALRKKQK